MKICKIDIKNFKGVHQFTADFDGQDATVYGANATGKTTVFDAYMWCLTGKDSLGQADFNIKRIDEGGEAHNLEHSVSVVLDIDGVEKSYGRIFKEKWTKKRGKAKAEFTGHTTDYSIDGLPCKMKEFDADVADTLIDNGLLWVLTDPLYFSNVLSWGKRRELLFDLCADVSELDIIENDPALHELKDIVIAGKQIDNIKRKISADKKAVNDEMQHIPARIDELLNQVVPIKEAPADVDALRKKHASISAKIAKLTATGTATALQTELDQKKIAMRQAQMNMNERAAEIDKKYEKQIKDIDNDIEGTERRVAKIDRIVEDHKLEIEITEKELAQLREGYAELVSMPIHVDGQCPTCGQPLTRDRIARSVGLLQKDKDAAIEANKAAGCAAAEEKAERISAIDQELGSRTELLRRLNAWHEAIEDIKSRWDAEKPAGMNEETQRLSVEIDALQRAIESQDANPEISKLEAMRQDIDEKIQDVAIHNARTKANDSLTDRVKKLEAREKELAAEYEKQERLLYLIEQLTRQKVAAVEDSINSRFSMVNFKLFSDQINGGLKECCEATVDGVPYASVNHAGRIQAGMDIINTLQQAHNKQLPIWIDGRESVIDLMPTDAQTISLVVSEEHNELEIKKGA